VWDIYLERRKFQHASAVVSGADMLAYLLARIHPSAGPLKRWFDACTEENVKRLMNLTYICKGRNIVRRRPRWNV